MSEVLNLSIPDEQSERTYFSQVIPDSSRLFFISDTHFNHAKLTPASPKHFERIRTYQTTKEMNDDMRTKWMTLIRPDDVVVFLGDFMMGHSDTQEEFDEKFNALYGPLPGNKLYIRGNHDKSVHSGLVDIRDYAVLRWRDKVYFCQHLSFFSKRPVDRPDSKNLMAYRQKLDPEKTVLVHGHTHEEERFSSLPWKDFKMQNNVSWEVAYAPIPAEKLYTANHIYHGLCEGHPVVALE